MKGVAYSEFYDKVSERRY